MAATEIQLVADGAGAVTLLHPLRRRILESLGQPASATGLSRDLGVPRQKINYHLRELEKQSLVELVEERKRGNCTERILRATARAYVISPEALGPLAADPERVQDRFSFAYLVALAARAIEDLGILRRKAARAGKRLATLSLETDVRFKSAADRAAFADELAQSLAALAAKYHDETAEGGRSFRFFVGGYPRLKRPTESDRAAGPAPQAQEDAS